MSILCILVLGVGQVLAGSGDEGSVSAGFLKIDPSASSAGFGSAFTARANDIHSIYFNPAGLSELKNYQGLFTYSDIFADIEYSYLAFAMPLDSGNYGAWGVSLSLMDFGDIERTQINGSNPVTGFGTFQADDFSVSLSYGKNLNSRLSLGGTLKYVKEEIFTFNDNAFTFDLGMRYKMRYSGLTFGLVYRNLGGGIRFQNEEDPLPGQLAAGFYLERERPGHTLNFGLDYTIPRDGSAYVGAGAEYTYDKLFSLRIGYNGLREEDDGLTLGAGFRFQYISVDYAFVPFEELGDQHRITVSMSFEPLAGY